MNRRNLIKSIPLLGFAPFVQAEEYPWPLECTLTPFQKKIWEAYNKHDYNLFILPRGAGKTFLFNRFYEIDGGDWLVNRLYGKDESGKKTILVDNLTLPFYPNTKTLKSGEPYSRINVFTSITEYNEISLKAMIGSGEFNVMNFPTESLSVNGKMPLITRAEMVTFREGLSTEGFRREILCEFA